MPKEARTPENNAAQEARYLYQFYERLQGSFRFHDEHRSEVVEVSNSGIMYPGRVLTHTQLFNFTSSNGVVPGVVMHFEDQKEQNYLAPLITIPDPDHQLQYWYNLTYYRALNGEVTEANTIIDPKVVQKCVRDILISSEIIPSERSTFTRADVLKLLGRALDVTSKTLFFEESEQFRTDITETLMTPRDKYMQARGEFSLFAGLCGGTLLDSRKAQLAPYTWRVYTQNAYDFLRSARNLGITYRNYSRLANVTNAAKEIPHWLSSDQLAAPISPFIIPTSDKFDIDLLREFEVTDEFVTETLTDL